MNPPLEQIIRELKRFENSLEKNEVEILLPPGKGDFKQQERLNHLQQGAIHANCEIFLQVGGYCRFDFLNDSLILKTGQILIVPSGVLHFEQVSDFAVGSFYNLVLIPTAHEFSMHSARAMRQMDETGRWRYVPVEEYEIKLEENNYFGYINAMLDRLFAERLLDDVFGEIRWLLQLLLHRIIAWNEEFRNVPQPPFGIVRYSSPKRKVKEAIEFICEFNGASIPSLAKVAAAVGCSVNYLSSIFRRETGVRIHTYIQNRRLDYAEKMVLSSPASITEIADACGFRCASYFSRIFRQRYGMEPLRYRCTRGVENPRKKRSET